MTASGALRHTIATGVVACAALSAACGKAKETKSAVQTETIGRRDIVIDAQATGTVEPINVVDVKSRASGQITRMPIDIGSVVKPGDLIVQIDTRDVQNNYDQASAQMKSAEASLSVATSQRKRSEELFRGKVITQAEFETAEVTFAQATAQVVNGRSQLDLAKQRLEDATIRAPIYGTIITRNVSLGTIITSSLNAVGGGTTLVQMADLSKVRARALVNETDIGGLKAGQPVRVAIDAYPDRPFMGTVERIEPQAVVQQSVTMFPVLVSLRNDEGLLRPGMNGEVSVVTDKREGSLAVPNDAVRSMRELASAAPLVGLTADSARALMAAPAAGRGAPSGDKATSERGATGGGAGGQSRAGDDAGRQIQMGKDSAGARGSKVRTALVFVQNEKGGFAPRMVRLGVANYDYAEVISGLKEGEKVALLSAAALQMARQQQNDRFKSMTGGGMPGATKAGGAGGGAPGGGGGGGGAPRRPGG